MNKNKAKGGDVIERGDAVSRHGPLRGESMRTKVVLNTEAITKN